MIPARSAPSHFSVLCKSLEPMRASGARHRSAGILHALAERIRRRGLVIILSDGFDELDELTTALRHLRHRRHEVLFFQMLAPEEEEFPFRRPRGSGTWKGTISACWSTRPRCARRTWKSSTRFARP